MRPTKTTDGFVASIPYTSSTSVPGFDGFLPRRGRRGPVRGEPLPVAVCQGGRPVARGTVCAPAVHGDVKEPLQLPRQVLDVHAGAAVDVRRVLAGQHGHLHVEGS